MTPPTDEKSRSVLKRITIGLAIAALAALCLYAGIIFQVWRCQGAVHWWACVLLR